MIELAEVKEGSLGQTIWFSDLFLAAARRQLTGGILVEAPNRGTAGVFFRRGDPVHVAGNYFENAFVGQILIDMKACTRSDVDQAAARQAVIEDDAPLLGAMLVDQAGVKVEEVHRAIQRQNQARIASLFGLTAGRWRAAMGMNARIEEIGVAIPPWPLFFLGLETQATDEELRSLSDTLLGRAVKLSGGKANLPDMPLSPAEEQLAAYLEKPRKPDQLERALRKRRMVRGFLRGLSLLDRLLVLPANKAIPIKKATLLKGADLPGAEVARAKAAAALAARESGAGPRKVTPVVKPKRVSANTHPIVKETEHLHARLTDISHFELLGVVETVTPTDLRRQYAKAAKRFHPDSFPNEITGDVAVKAREISARINEAYDVLSDPQKRRDYRELLADDRIKGDARRAERVRDAALRSKMAQVHLRRREYHEARELFRFAMQTDPETALYGALFAWSTFSDPNCDRSDTGQECERLLREGVKANPQDANLHFYLGTVLKAHHRPKEALTFFQKAQELDRSHTDAQREVRLLLRQQKKTTDEPRSALSRLFRK